MTKWTKQSCLARERDSHDLPAIGAFVAGDAFPWITAGKKSFNGVVNDGAEEAVVFGITPMIAFLKVVEILVNDLEQRAFVEEAGPVVT